MAISQEDFQRAVSKSIMGGPSPFLEETHRGLPVVVTFSGESVRWIGKATADRTIFGGGKYQTYPTFLGVSPYRIVLFGQTRGDNLCQSVWFEVDFEGMVYKARKGRKRLQYARLFVSPPELKGAISKSIHFVHRATGVHGKEYEVGQYPLQWIESYDRQARKFRRGGAQAVYDQLMEAYRKRVPVPVTALWYLAYKPREAVRISLPGGDTATTGASAPQVEPGGASRPAAPAAVAQPTTPRPEASAPSAAMSASGATCAACGAPMRPGSTFCGKCGAPLEGSAVAEGLACPGCGATVEEDWRVCPQCGQKLILECPECGGRIEEHWRICPHCHHDLKSSDSDSDPTLEQEVQSSCPQCGEPVEADWRICPVCTTPLRLKCPECGERVEFDWRTCPFCATPLPTVPAADEG